MARIFYQSDCNLQKLNGKTVAIIGYGSQGHAHALNLKDSGVNVVVGLYEGSKSWARAEAQGLKVMTSAEATKIADIIMILINDEKQATLYKESIEPNLTEGKTLEEAKTLTARSIGEPYKSEHNLGLAVDFNDVNYEFEEEKAFPWLVENAENYGFILRYPKDKEEITKIKYEPWHWRYVGIENAKEINKLGFCLEEYIQYLKTGNRDSGTDLKIPVHFFVKNLKILLDKKYILW